jgi:hypothetical protein
MMGGDPHLASNATKIDEIDENEMLLFYAY